jgi:hypothetical protein
MSVTRFRGTDAGAAFHALGRRRVVTTDPEPALAEPEVEQKMRHQQLRGRATLLRASLLLAVLAMTGSAAADTSDAFLPVTHDGGHRHAAASAGAWLGACGALTPVIDEHGSPHGCTHGPDPAPPGVDHTIPWPGQAEEPVPATAQSLPPPVLPCYGDGTSGPRVQAIYAVPAGSPDRYSTVAPSIARWAAETDYVFSQSAQQTGGTRHIRYVTDRNCNLIIQKVNLSTLGDDTFSNTMSELRAQGFSRPDRKYLVWMESTVLCGIAGYYIDDRPGQDNPNNGTAPGQIGRIDSGCWGLASRGQSVEAHELLHNLGGVQPTAPNATALGHCDDDADRMCYADGSPGLVIRNVCPASHEAFLDCGKNDYYSTSPPAGSYLATRWNTARSSFLDTQPPQDSVPVTAPPQPPPPSPSPSPSTGPSALPIPAGVGGADASSRFTTLTPSRVFDTRTGNGGRTGKLGPGQSYDLTVVGRGGVPESGVGGVLLNLTVTQPTAASELTAYPTGTEQPQSPNLVFLANQTRPNLVAVPVGSGGRIRITNRSGSTHALADVVGWFDSDGGTARSRFSSLTPDRILDTRTGVGAARARLGAQRTLSLQVTGRGGVPAAGVSGVVMNVTVTNPSAPSFLTLYPSGQSMPLASQLNFVPNQTVPNLVFVATGAHGRVDIYNAGGETNVIADVVGWLDNGSHAARSDFAALPPRALLDTRSGAGGRSDPLRPGDTATIQVTGQAGVPSSGVAGVLLNVSALDPSAAGFLTVYPTGTERPLASNLNFLPRSSTANVVAVPVGQDGRIDVYNPLGTTHVRADVVGFFDGG